MKSTTPIKQISVTIKIEKARKKAKKSKYNSSYITSALDFLDKLDRRALSYKELIYILAGYYNCTNDIIHTKEQYKFLSNNLELCEMATIEAIGDYGNLYPSYVVEKMAYTGHKKLGEIVANLLNIKLSELTQVPNPNPPKFL